MSKPIQVSIRTKAGIFPLRNKGAVVAALWLQEEKESKPLAVQFIGRQPSKATGPEYDKFERGYYDIGGLWNLFQTNGLLLGENSAATRFYGIGEQKKLSDAEKWTIKKQESCVAYGARISLQYLNETQYSAILAIPSFVKDQGYSGMLWAPSEEKLEALLSALAVPDKNITNRVFSPSRYQKWLCISPELISGGYVFANTAEKAKSYFQASLKMQKICCPDEWQEAIWQAFETRGWLQPLEGINMAGFKLINDPYEARILIGEMIRNSFHPTDKGFDPSLPILPYLPGM